MADLAPFRVILVGNSGSGKSTFARRLADRRGCSYIELDALHWSPGWIEVPDHQFRAALSECLTEDAWVVDGNYLTVQDLTWPRATHVVWLDYPRWRVMWRVLARTIRRGLRREVVCNGNRESLRMSFLSRDSILWWAWSTHRRRRAELGGLFAQPPYPHLTLFWVRTPAEAEALLDRLSVDATERASSLPGSA